jgi:voltage-gated potassium channel
MNNHLRLRIRTLQSIEDILDMPMMVLSIIWLILFIVEFVYGLPPILQVAGTVIWIVFLFDFGLRMLVAPAKLKYLRSNWLTAVSLVLPALRIFRVLRAFTVLRGARVLRAVGTVNRAMAAAKRGLAHRGLAYVLALTMIVVLVGAAAIFNFEKDVPDPRGIHNFGKALWWTGMMITTMGSEYWPRTAEGQIISFILALYSFTMLGYVTANLATFFMGERPQAAVNEEQLREIRAELSAIRAAVAGTREHPSRRSSS